jgi:aarF domain-containing kinase
LTVLPLTLFCCCQNIFVLEDGRVGLIDFGQVKQISGRNRETLCKIMIALDEREGDERREDLDLIGKLAIELGVEFRKDAGREASAAVGMWLFDGTVERLPGGYDLGELSPNSPVKEIKSFPQDLVLVGRSSILIKGLSSRLGIPWSLAKEWAPIARNVLANNYRQASTTDSDHRVRFHDVWKTFRQWSRGRATGVVRRLPTPIRSKVIGWVAAAQERKARRTMTHRP